MNPSRLDVRIWRLRAKKERIAVEMLRPLIYLQSFLPDLRPIINCVSIWTDIIVSDQNKDSHKAFFLFLSFQSEMDNNFMWRCDGAKKNDRLIAFFLI
jgi:hypothetical protein